MFDGLDSIDWMKLSHSHGTAEDVPSQLKMLTSASEHDTESALSFIWEHMLHQGSHFEASPHVVPFLFEVLELEECCIRRELIDLLLGLAVGYGESFLPPGLVGDDYHTALSEFVAEFTAGDRLSQSELIRRSGNVSTWDEEKHWP